MSNATPEDRPAALTPRSRPQPAPDRRDPIDPPRVTPAPSQPVTAPQVKAAPASVPAPRKKEVTEQLNTRILTEVRDIADEAVRTSGLPLRRVIEIAIRDRWGTPTTD